MIEIEEEWNRKTAPLYWGYALSLLLTFTAYFLAPNLYLLLGAATVQALVQFVLFLHLGIESRPAWGLFMFLLMLFVIIILVAGSIWIMHNLNYNLGAA